MTAADQSACPEARVRSAMSDDDFWSHVLLGEQLEYFDPDEDDLDQTSTQNEPCPECGERGPCGYDMLGRPMIHTTEDDDESEG